MRDLPYAVFAVCTLIIPALLIYGFTGVLWCSSYMAAVMLMLVWAYV